MLKRGDAAAAGFDPQKLSDAVRFAQTHESQMDRDIGQALQGGHFSEPLPDGEIIGPTKPRGNPSGMILRRGKVVSEWGPTDATDMTFSVTKSYLSICAGLAYDDDLLRLDEPCIETIGDLFDTEQNRRITWRHLLTNSSEWQGTLWGKEDRIDHYRSLETQPGATSQKGTLRPLQAAGSYWEYNDIRVNVLAYALMLLVEKPLPQLLRERIMRPIGASDDWEWHGYGVNSTVRLNDRDCESVSGGAHWGGGLFISTEDHARVAQLMAESGRWGTQQLISQEWIERCRTPCQLNRSYGLLWWLNVDGNHMPSAPRTSYFALGVGRNVIWIDPQLEIVAVVRWIDRDNCDGFCGKVMGALRP